MTHKQCFKCGLDKEFSEFHTDRKNKTGYRSYCKSCANIHSKEWYASSEKYRAVVREAGLRKRFGIGLDDYYEMLEDQKGVCAICKQSSSENFHVDHSHATGEVRGLLCKMCNHGLGNFRDNPDYLMSAIEYLDKNIPSNS